MLHSDSPEGDAIVELVADLNNLMLIHVKIVCRTTVQRKQLDEADGIGESVHSARAFGIVKVDAGNPLRHYLFPLTPNNARDSSWIGQLSGFYGQTERAYRD
jgi:hypothetical protein